MNSNTISPKTIFVISVIAIAALSRLFPHPPNLTAIGGVAIFGGAMFSNKKFSVLLPLSAMFVSDLIIEAINGTGFHANMFAVYFSFAIITLIGYAMRNNINTKNIILASFASSTLFFLVTNFSVWMGNPMFTQDFAGLLNCYILGLAFYTNDIFGNFFLNSFMGDIFFTSLLFAVYSLTNKLYPALIKVKKN